MRNSPLRIVSVLLTALPFTAEAQKTALSYDKNGGGTSYTSMCALDEVLIGFETKFTDLLQRVVSAAPICRAVSGEGKWVGVDKGVTLVSFLFDGPTTFKKIRCAQNSAVTYLIVQSIDEVLELVVFCKALAANGTVTGSNQEAGRVPTTFYPGFFEPLLNSRSDPNVNIKRTDLQCANSLPARGAYGNSGMFEDRIGLNCVAPLVTASVAFQTQILRPGEGTLSWVTLNRPNPNPLPISVALTSNVAGVTVPSSVVLMPGADKMVFSIKAPSVSAMTPVTITAKIANGSGPGASATFVIQP